VPYYYVDDVDGDVPPDWLAGHFTGRAHLYTWPTFVSSFAFIDTQSRQICCLAHCSSRNRQRCRTTRGSSASWEHPLVQPIRATSWSYKLPTSLCYGCELFVVVTTVQLTDQLRYMMPQVSSNKCYTFTWFFQFVEPGHQDTDYNPLFYPIWTLPNEARPARCTCLRISVGIITGNNNVRPRWNADEAVTSHATPHPTASVRCHHTEVFHFENAVLGQAIGQGWLSFDITLNMPALQPTKATKTRVSRQVQCS
jgi:hypothetical protein